MQISIFMRDRLCIDVENGSIDEITSRAFYKINVKRYVDHVEGKLIFFQERISYLSVKKIVKAFQTESMKGFFTIVIEPTVEEYISSRELYLQTRSKLGIEIKEQDYKLNDQYNTFRSVVADNMERKLRDKQLWDSFFMTIMKKSCNFSVPGSGKTSSVYGMFAFLRSKKLVKRIVVVCPKSAFGTWIDEYSACFGKKAGLNCFNIHDEAYHSLYQKINAVRYESGAADLLLFNYECIKSLKEEIKSLLDDKTILVFDEVHKVKRINGEYANAAIEISKGASFVIAMTGTPIPNSYQDIYNLLHILYGEEYEDFFGYSPQFLKNPTKNEVCLINKKIQPIFCRTTKQELNVPAPNTDSIFPVPAEQHENALFQILLKKYKKNKLLLMLRTLQLESNPRQLLDAINLADYQYILDDEKSIDEIDYVDYSDDIRMIIENAGVSSKTKQCINLIKGLNMQRKPVVVWCIYIKTINNLYEQLKQMGIKAKCIYGEIELKDRQIILEEFKQKKFDVLITNPNTLAESISLHTICHDAVYFLFS